MDFITIDFETANSYRNSACEIGLSFVKDNQIIETKSWLIRPKINHFDPMNISIHGITAGDVWKEPRFDELWKSDLKDLLENQFLIAHNASFDFSVLRKTLDAYDLPYPDLSYSCSYLFAKKIWTEMPRYDLKTLCNQNEIYFRHHRAGSDADATAQLALKGFEKMNITCQETFSKKLEITIGKLFKGGYIPSTNHKKAKRKPKIS